MRAYVEGLCALQATDQAISGVIAGSRHNSDALRAVCEQTFTQAARLITDAQADGSLRNDVTLDGLRAAAAVRHLLQT
jgi:hypothetical protein